jgi:beta-lactamase regulating signal transducer with metallopeptidase domain
MSIASLTLAASIFAASATPGFSQQLQSLATSVSQGMLGSLLAGSLLAVLAAAALRLMTRQNSRTRFAVCLATLLALAALPFIASFSGAAAAQGAAANAVVRLPESWALYLFAAWATVAVVAFAHVLIGLVRLYQVRGTCIPVPSSAIDARLQRALGEFQATRRVALCTSDALRVPTAIGLWKPVVALPAWCLRDLSADELHAVVLHELEHLRRFDDWTNLLQQIIAAVFFFHPAVWWLESRLSLEREMACDDAVLARVPDPRGYAKCLLTLAEKSIVRRGLALAQAAVSRVQQLSARIARILDAGRPGNTQLWAPALSLVAVASVAGAVSIAWAPRLIAFQPAHAMLADASTVPPGSIDRGFVPLSANPEHSTSELKARLARWPASSPAAPRTASSTHQLAVLPKHQPVAPAPKSDAIVSGDPGLIASESQTSTAPADRTLTQVNLHQVSPSAMLVMFVQTEQHEEAGMTWTVQTTRWVILPAQQVKRIIDLAAPSKT